MKIRSYTGMNEKTHWKKLNNPDYLGAYAFQPGEEKTVTIKDVKRQAVYNQSAGGKEECTVAYFVEDVKPLILNVTNCKTIAKVWGTPYIEDWAGRRIILKVKKISAFGDMVDAVRVAAERPADEEIICEACGNPVTGVNGRTPKMVADTTKAKCGKVLCLACAKKEAK
jgi:hypothetical protein